MRSHECLGGVRLVGFAVRIGQSLVARPCGSLRPFYLWTRQAVLALVRREYGIELSLTTVGRYLKSRGMTAQKPVRRAYERNDEAIVSAAIQ